MFDMVGPESRQRFSAFKDCKLSRKQIEMYVVVWTAVLANNVNKSDRGREREGRKEGGESKKKKIETSVFLKAVDGAEEEGEG